jgi:hypothetical protein
MKKFLTAGVLALTVAACSHQQASAWINCKFGIGLNWNWQSGGNNMLWGVFRNGQPGAPDWECHRQCGYNYAGYGSPMMSSPMGYPSADFHAAYMPATTPAVQYGPYGYSGYQTVNFAPDFDYGFSYMQR